MCLAHAASGRGDPVWEFMETKAEIYPIPWVFTKEFQLILRFMWDE